MMLSNLMAADARPVRKKTGRPGNGSNTTVYTDERGTTYLAGRLKRDKPELAAEVIA